MEKEHRETVEVVLANRAFLYELLYKTFAREPDRELLEMVTAPEAAESFALLSEEENDILARTPAFLSAIRKNLEQENFIEDLKTEYTKLFIGPGSLVAPPWESVYFGEDALLFQETTLKVRRFYHSFQMQPQAYLHVADDSLALELAFMSKLAERAMKAFEAEDDAELKKNLDGASRFLAEHMLVWVPKFLERMRSAATDCFYPRFCFVLDSFLSKDKKAVDEVLTLLS